MIAISAEVRRWAILAIKWSIAAVALTAVAFYVAKTWQKLSANEVQLAFHPQWLLVAVLAHQVGQVAFGCNFWRIMRREGEPVSAYAAIRAHLIGHLGKYVPGKALVVIMRVGLVQPYGSRISTAAWAAMYETLTMMAAGGLVAGSCLLVGLGWEEFQAIGLALREGQGLAESLSAPTLTVVISSSVGLGLGLALTILATPPAFSRLTKLLSMPFPRIKADALPVYTWSGLSEGLLWSILGWLSWGLSQWAVLAMLGVALNDPSAWLVVLGSVALATVSGFAIAVLPGGLGIRESVLITLLQLATANPAGAVVAGLTLRLIWVASELASSGILGLARPRRIVHAQTEGQAEPQQEDAADTALLTRNLDSLPGPHVPPEVGPMPNRLVTIPSTFDG